MIISNYKTYISILLITIPFISFSQSEKDTQEWIKSNLYNHVYTNGSHNYSTDFPSKGILKVTQPTFGTDFYFRIPLAKIDQLLINSFSVEGREGYSIKLICKDREDCIIVTNNNTKLNLPPSEFLSVKELFLDKSFGEDNLPIRMKKALTHLIELNGGKTISDIF